VTVTALAGGVGGAKLLVGLAAILDEGDLTAVVNTGDDAVIYGVHVSPDIDIVTYWLGGVADTHRGWGIRDDTFAVVDALGSLGAPAWFRLGDRDLATCLYRTERLRDGAPLSAVTDEIRRALGVTTHVLPATDDPLQTRILTSDGRTLEFQDYFVRERQEPEVTGVVFSGAEDAKPAPGVLEAIAGADCVVVCPSNPILSIGPILEVPEIRETLQRHPHVIAVTPIVRGEAIKGPAARILDRMRIGSSATAVARLYADFADMFVMDSGDRRHAADVTELGLRALVVDTLMTDRVASERLARQLLGA
jgi:LPPG:FO 2-phospho-L-lactate transferase